MDRIEDYDYELPAELIAARPLARRDAARMLVLDRADGGLLHRHVFDLPEFLRAGDCLVVNDTRVLPARLIGTRTGTGGRWEGLFLTADDQGRWEVIGQTRGRLQAGETITVTPVHPERAAPGETLVLTLLERRAEGAWLVEPSETGPPETVLPQFGTVPLPPYIGRETADAEDWQRYQTVYANRAGAVAAPTAGLHLTDELLARCRERDVGIARVTLHVGIGTFRPVQTERLDDHQMHAEWCEVTPATAIQLQGVRAAGGRIVAVGTTTVRTLESAAQGGELRPFSGPTDIFIRPGWTFRAVDGLLTNFHLPRSTLLVMLSAFAGRERIQSAYREAVEQRYRFYSYGDAMLIL
jgi:S-adenosylmethionine:tRNA ribosyltransferase-isomerase